MGQTTIHGRIVSSNCVVNMNNHKNLLFSIKMPFFKNKVYKLLSYIHLYFKSHTYNL